MSMSARVGGGSGTIEESSFHFERIAIPRGRYPKFHADETLRGQMRLFTKDEAYHRLLDDVGFQAASAYYGSEHYRKEVDRRHIPRTGEASLRRPKRRGEWYGYDFLAFIEIMGSLGLTGPTTGPATDTYWDDLFTVHQDLFHFLSGGNAGSTLVGHDKFEATRRQHAWVCLEVLGDMAGGYCGSILYYIDERGMGFFNITKSCTTKCSGLARVILKDLERIAREEGAVTMRCTQTPLGIMANILVEHGFDGDRFEKTLD